MWSITLKLMRKTKRMLIPAGIAIMIGTAFIASTFLFGNAMNDSLTRQLTAMFGKRQLCGEHQQLRPER